jgi:hypothetical protein
MINSWALNRPLTPEPTMTVKVSTLKHGQRVQAGYRQWTTPCKFVGFGLNHSDSPRWPDLGNAYMTADCKNMKALEAWANAKGVTVYAVFEDVKDGDRWAAYLWKGRFCVGSSADRLELAGAA